MASPRPSHPKRYLDAPGRERSGWAEARNEWPFRPDRPRAAIGERWRSRSSKSMVPSKGGAMKRIAPVVLAAVASVSFAATAEASRNRDATLAVSPSATVASDNLVSSGCGYEPGKGVSVRVESPYAISFSGALAGADGCFSTMNTYTAQQVGGYEALAFQSNAR